MIDFGTVTCMKTCDEIRLENARKLMSGKPAEFAQRLKISGQQANQIIGPNPSRNIGTAIARKIEEEYGQEVGWLDNDHERLAQTEGHSFTEAAHALVVLITQCDLDPKFPKEFFIQIKGLLQLSYRSSAAQDEVISPPHDRARRAIQKVRGMKDVREVGDGTSGGDHRRGPKYK